MKKICFGKKIAIIGIGVSNTPIIEYLHGLGAKITVFDQREEQEINTDIYEMIKSFNIQASFGKNYLSKLVGFDVIFRSPSCVPTIPEIQAERERGAVITSEIEKLIELCPGKIIGVTGSDGKTTTTSLIYEILKTAGYTCYLGGNIGIPLFTKLHEISENSYVVLELSSFQLMNMKISPDIAVVTNVTPNHLNVHKSYDEYIDAKKNILKFQSTNSIAVLNYDNDITKNMAKEAAGKVILFSSKSKLENGYIVDDWQVKICKNGLRRRILSIKEIYLRGIHNLENICAALAATSTLVDIDTQIKAVKQFKGVEHRLEFVREINNVKWYNDSIGTSPTRTIAGLNSFDEKIVLIAGGYDKHLDYEPLAKPIIDHCDALILIRPNC